MIPIDPIPLEAILLVFSQLIPEAKTAKRYSLVSWLKDVEKDPKSTRKLRCGNRVGLGQKTQFNHHSHLITLSCYHSLLGVHVWFCQDWLSGPPVAFEINVVKQRLMLNKSEWIQFEVCQVLNKLFPLFLLLLLMLSLWLLFLLLLLLMMLICQRGFTVQATTISVLLRSFQGTHDQVIVLVHPQTLGESIPTWPEKLQ